MRTNNLASFCLLLCFLTACTTTKVDDEGLPKSSELKWRLEFVDVDGFGMRAKTYGLEGRAPGAPILVFENGSASPLESWGDLPDKVKELAPVILYDRATVGQSEWDGEDGTPEHVISRLSALLDALDAPPPYILIGWSWGGDLIRYHASARPDDIAGLVYVDPAAHSPAAELALMERLGLGQEGLDKKVKFLAEATARELPPQYAADIRYIDDLLAGGLEHEYGDVPSVPAVALISGKRPSRNPDELNDQTSLPLSQNQEYQALLPGKLDRVSSWVRASDDGLLVFCASCYHAIHREEPELVLLAIKRILNSLDE